MGNEAVQAFVRSTLTQGLIDKPESFKLFEAGIFSRPVDFIQISHIAFNSIILKYLTEEIFIESFSTPDRPDPGEALRLTDEEIKRAREIVGGDMKVASSTRVRKADKGYIISMPTFHGTGLDTVAIFFGAYEQPENKKKVDKILMKLMKGSGIETLSKPVDLKIPVKEILAEQPWFKRESIKTVPAKAFDAYSKFVKGMRIMAPPVPKSAGQFVSDKGETIEMKDAGDPLAFLRHSMERRVFTVYAELYIPEDFAEYITQTPASKINATHIALWASMWMLGEVGKPVNKKKGFEASEAITPIGSVRIRNQEALKKDVAPPRVNEDNIGTLANGRLIYVPDIDRVEEYEGQLDNYATTGNGEFAINDITKLPLNQYTFNETQEDKRKQSEKRLSENVVVYTDWVNRKLSYTNKDGLVEVLELEGLAPTTPLAIRNTIAAPIAKSNTQSKYLIGYLTYSLGTRLSKYGKSLNDFIKDSDLTSILNTTSVAYRRIVTDLDSYNLKNLAQNVHSYFESGNAEEFGVSKELVDRYRYIENHTFADLHKDSSIPIYRPIGRALEFLASKIDQDVGEFISHRNVDNSLHEIAIIRNIVKYGGPSLKALNELVVDNQKQYTNPKIEEDHTPTPVPYIKDAIFMYPHQNKADNVLSNNTPKFTVLDIAAGGGKTFIITKHLVELLHRKVAKKPLVICPGGLVKNYVEEAAYFFEGKVNVVCITTKVYRRHGEEFFRKLIKAAPPNTIYVTDFSFVKSGIQKVFYGNKQLKVSKNTELLRLFDFDAVAIDEAHYLRNDSTRTKAAKRLCSDIGRIILATGTLFTKQLSDVVNLMGMFDPGIFGDIESFVEEYANDYIGSKIISLKPGSEAKVREIMGKNCALVRASSKEWAALLPYKNERFYFPEMTEAQRALYEDILREELEKLKAFLAKNKKAAKLLSDQDVDDEDDNDDEDEIDESELEALLKPYMQRMEMYLTAPEKDVDGARILKGKDRIGPKVRQVIDICRDHIKNQKGKIIIFTSYNNSATSIYENMPPDLKKMTVHYHAESKDKDLAQFARDPNTRILVGIEESMKEGHNLQMATRIIRTETVWNPGSLDQAQARIDRPDPKNLAGGERSEIFLDWICVNKSIDVTKTSRLISRILSKVKFDEPDNPKYENVGSLPVISMSLEAIREVNDWEGDLKPYLDEYSEFKGIQRDDYDDYRKKLKNIDKMTKPVKASKKGIDGAAYLEGIPYINDHTIPLSKELGILPYSDYVAEHSSGEGFEDFDSTGLRAHTEYGDGIITKVLKGSVMVALDKGYNMNCKKLTVSILTKPLKTAVTDIIAEKTGLPVIKDLATSRKTLKKEQKLREEKEKQKTRKLLEKRQRPTKPIPNEDVKENASVNVFFSIINGMIAVGIDNEPDADEKILKKFGFTFSAPYYFAHVPNYRAFDKLIDKLMENFEMRQKYVDRMEALMEAFTRGKQQLLNAERAMQMDIRNFYLQKLRKVKKGWLRPYPVIQDGELFICATIPNQPSAIELPRKARVPTVTWDKSDGEWIKFCKDKVEAKNVVVKLKEAGVNIANYKTLQEEYKEIKLKKSVRMPKRSR